MNKFAPIALAAGLAALSVGPAFAADNATVEFNGEFQHSCQLTAGAAGTIAFELTTSAGNPVMNIKAGRNGGGAAARVNYTTTGGSWAVSGAPNDLTFKRDGTAVTLGSSKTVQLGAVSSNIAQNPAISPLSNTSGSVLASFSGQTTGHEAGLYNAQFTVTCIPQ